MKGRYTHWKQHMGNRSLCIIRKREYESMQLVIQLYHILAARQMGLLVRKLEAAGVVSQ